MKERLQGWLMLAAVITVVWSGCTLVARINPPPRYRSAMVQTRWESSQMREWSDTTEVVRMYMVRADYLWAEIDSLAFSQIRIGDSLTVVSAESVYVHGRYAGRFWRIGYPARIED